MFTRDQGKIELKGIEVQDGLAMLHLVRRLVKSGVIEDIELAPLAVIRSRLVKKIEEVTGVNYDAALAQVSQRGMASVDQASASSIKSQ